MIIHESFGKGILAMRLWKLFLLVFICVLISHAGWADNECAAGQYKNGDACELCPVGSYCDNDTEYNDCGGCVSIDEENCTDQMGAIKCLPCPDASLPNNNHTACEQCVAGNYIDAGECKTCPAGSFCDDGVATLCSGATISESGASACTNCSGDTPYANSNHTQCVACDGTGEYHDNDGICDTCGTGNFPNSDHTACVQCGAGNYMDDDECKTCPAGYYCSGDGAATASPAGRFNSGTGAGSVSSCTVCPKGTYSVGGAAACSNCPGGTTTDGTGTEQFSGCHVPDTIKLGGIPLPSNVFTNTRIYTRVIQNKYQNNTENN